MHAAGWEWWNWTVLPVLIKGIGRLQRLALYQRTATIWLDRTKAHRKFIVRVPLSAHQSHDLYREIPADQFEPSQPLWQGKPALRWILNLHFNAERTPVGTATVAWHPAGCPRGEGWRVGEQQIRTKYRGAGLEEALFHEAQGILARSGMTLQRLSK
jgi:hypothetical protein